MGFRSFESHFDGSSSKRVTSIWAYRGAALWVVLNLVDMAESPVAPAIGWGRWVVTQEVRS